MERKEKVISHESFALARFSRCFGHSGYMFGSEVQSDNFIELEISSAEMIRDSDLSMQHFYPTKNIVKVKMSQSQFAELLTTMNCGTGIPVTIEEKEGKIVNQQSPDNYETMLDYQRKVYNQRIADLKKYILKSKKEANDLISKKTLSKQDQSNLSWIIEKLLQEVDSNIPFFIKVFKEDTDNIVSQAKSEIDAHVQRIVTETGIKQLYNNTKIKAIEDK